MMGITSDLKVGAVIKYNGENVYIYDCEFRKPGKGGAFYKVKFRNIRSGKIGEHTYNSGESVEFVRIENHSYQYLYKDGSNFVLMNNENYDQITVPDEMVGSKQKFLKENSDVFVGFEGETPLYVQVPKHINLRVTYTEPGLKGDTATNASKPATLETGAEIRVPLFVNENDLIRVDTEQESYIERVKE